MSRQAGTAGAAIANTGSNGVISTANAIGSVRQQRGVNRKDVRSNTV